MKAFTFRLETLLHLRERAKDQAIKDYALSISKREKAELSLRKAVQNLKSSNEEIKQRRAAGFVGFEQDGFNQSIVQLKENIIELNSKVAESKNIESAKREIYLTADSNCKSLLKLKEKKKEEHLKSEEKKEEAELEDIIGARFVFNQ
jgi:flagellar export protein FliJ